MDLTVNSEKMNEQREIDPNEKTSFLNRPNLSFYEELKQKDLEIEEQKKTIENLKKELEKQSFVIEELTNQLQKKEKKSNISINDSNSKQGQSRYWTQEEHKRFLEALQRFGEKDVKSIAAYVGSRSPTQVRTHGQKYFLRLERERKRKEEGRMSDNSSPSTPSPLTNIEFNDKQTNEKSHLKKRKSIDSPQNMLSYINTIPSYIQTPPPTPPSLTKDFDKILSVNPVIPLFIQEQIAAETKECVLPVLKGPWSEYEYNAFIQGLVAFSEEKDINIRCALISKHFLPSYTSDQIKQCFMVLSNVAKDKERDEPREELANIEAKVKAEIFVLSQYDSDTQMRNLRFSPQNSVSFTQYNESMGQFGYLCNSISIERRASYPMDIVSKMKYDQHQETMIGLEHGMWNVGNPDGLPDCGQGQL